MSFLVWPYQSCSTNNGETRASRHFNRMCKGLTKAVFHKNDIASCDEKCGSNTIHTVGTPQPYVLSLVDTFIIFHMPSKATPIYHIIPPYPLYTCRRSFYHPFPLWKVRSVLKVTILKGTLNCEKYWKIVKSLWNIVKLCQDKAIPATYKCVASEEITSDEVSVSGRKGPQELSKQNWSWYILQYSTHTCTPFTYT